MRYTQMNIYDEQLQTIDQEIAQLTHHMKDYQQLAKQLESLTIHLHSKIMVPITKMAFMEGLLKQSHGVTMLLGDGWFAEMSLHEACEVIKRRLHYLDTRLQEWQTLRKDINQRSTLVHEKFVQPSLSTSNSKFLDIQEPLDDKDEASQFVGSRIAHKPSTSIHESHVSVNDRMVSLEGDIKERQQHQRQQQESSSHVHVTNSELDRLCRHLVELEKIELTEEGTSKTPSTSITIPSSSLSSSSSTIAPLIHSPMDIRDEYPHPSSPPLSKTSETQSSISSSEQPSKSRISRFKASRQATSSSLSQPQQYHQEHKH